VLLSEIVPVAMTMTRLQGQPPAAFWVPRAVAAVLAMPITIEYVKDTQDGPARRTHPAAAYVNTLVTGAIRWESAGAIAAVQAAMGQILPAQQAPSSGGAASAATAAIPTTSNNEVLELSKSLRSREDQFGEALPTVYLDCTSGVAAALVANKTSRLTQATRTPRSTADALLADVAELLPSTAGALVGVDTAMVLLVPRRK
jgi:hypothetical protein